MGTNGYICSENYKTPDKMEEQKPFRGNPDGLHTVTFRIDPGMRWLGESMVAEMRDIVKVLAADHRRQQKAGKDGKTDDN